MRPSVKIGLVVAGYAIALVIASVVVAVQAVFMSSVDRQASSGMSAFGDILLFLAVFGAAAIPATGVGLYFLRPHGPFWRAFSFIALAMAATGVAACVVIVAGRSTGTDSALRAWSDLAVIRVLAAPFLALMSGLSFFFAPNRIARVALAVAAAIEAATFGLVALLWFRGF